MMTSHVRSRFSRIVLGAMAGLSLITAQSEYAQAQVQAVAAQATQKVLTPAERAKLLEAKRQAWKNRNKVIVKPAPGTKVIVKTPVVPGAPAKVIVKTPPGPAVPAKVIVKTPVVPGAPAKVIVKSPVVPGAPAKVIVKTPAQPTPAVAAQPQPVPVTVQRPPQMRRWQPVTRQVSRPVPGAVVQKGALPANAPLVVRMAKQPRNLNAIKLQREKTVDRQTNQIVIKEPGNRVIVRQNNRAVIVKNDSDRMVRVAKTRSLTRSDGTNVTIIQRPNNNSVYNVTDANGQLVRRYRRNAQGHEHNIIDNRRRDKFGRNLALGVGIGVGVAAGAILLNSLVDVPPPRVDVPRRKYIVDYDQADDEEVYEAFSAPPVDDRLERRYSLDEVRATPRLRERMRRVDLNDITFDTGSWEVEESQYGKLERVARAMMRVVERDPNEVFMIEGYTDAVGSEDDNLTLSDRRAESVAVILTEQFQVPPENLTTQGFGEEYKKVETYGPERLNRRVAARRITPLLSQNEGDEPPQQ